MDTNNKRITRVDVAKAAGVSTATVSYVLNKSVPVRAATEAKVMKAVNELGYRPDPIARSMVTRKTMQLSVVLNNIANPIYSDMILGFEKKALEHGYFVNICTGKSFIDQYFDNFVNRRIDGVFIEALPNKYHIEKVYQLVEAEINVIMFGHGGVDLRKVSSIENDYIVTMEMAVKHLWDLGHRRIAYISGLTRVEEYDLRIKGYEKAMAKRGASSIAADLCICSPQFTDTEIADGKRLAKFMVEQKLNFSAAICTNDLMAIGAIQGFTEAGLRIPRDVSVMGIDGGSFGEIVSPKLTTMSANYYDLGIQAFELLYTNMTKNTKGFYQNIPQLVIRESTCAKE